MRTPYDSYDYVGYWEGRDFEDFCEREALAKLLKIIAPRSSLIDIGGGFGRLLSLYAPYFDHCLVLDPSEKHLAIGRKKAQNFPQVSFRRGSLPKLSFEDGSFDVALMIRLSHHLPDLYPSFKEISRLLKPGGFLVIEVANKIHFLARIRAFLTGDFSFARDLEPIERRSWQHIKEESIPFSNHHPQKVIADLGKAGFFPKEILSVSNFRSPILKKILLLGFLEFLEKKLQKPLSRSFFGPSIFILAQKVS